MKTNDDDKPQYNEDTFPWYGRVLEWVLLRVIYFVGTYVLIVTFMLFCSGYIGSYNLIRLAVDALSDPNGLIIIGVISLLSAIFGPWLYQKHRERVAGNLQEVKAMERELASSVESDAEYAKRILEGEEGK